MHSFYVKRNTLFCLILNEIRKHTKNFNKILTLDIFWHVQISVRYFLTCSNFNFICVVGNVILGSTSFNVGAEGVERLISHNLKLK